MTHEPSAARPLAWLARRPTSTLLLAILILAAILRLGLVLALPGIFAYEQTGQIHGSTAYDTYALNLIETGVLGREPGVPDGRLAPLYMVVVAGIYSTLGRSGLAIAVAHTAFDLLAMLALYGVGARLFDRERQVAGRTLGEWTGLGGALFMACYPYLIFQNMTLNDTALFTLLLHLFMLALVMLRERPAFDRWTLLWAILAGLALGTATLARAILPVLAILAALWFLVRLSLWQTFLRLGIVALLTLALLIPWSLRNSQLYGGPVLIALNLGENFYQGANDQTIPLFRAGYDVQWSAPPPNADRDNPYNNNRILLDAGLDWIRHNPDRIPELLWVKFLVHWSIDIAPLKNPLPGETFALADDGSLLVIPGDDLQDIETIALYSEGLFDRVGRPVHGLYFGGLLLLAVVGVVVSARRWRDVALLWCVPINFTLMYLVFHPSTRYRVPADPLLFLFSAFALAWLAWRWGRTASAQHTVQGV